MPTPKPASCAGCPLYGLSAHYVPDEVVPGATVFILGQNPGATEVAEGRPFCGATGRTMEDVYFPLAGLVRGETVSIGNTIRCRVGQTNDLPTGTALREAADHCNRAYLRIPESAKVIVAQGAVAWNWLQGYAGLSLTDWRGHIGPQQYAGLPVFGTLHLADLLPNRNPRMTLPTKHDWQRIPAIVQGTWPQPLPPRLVVGGGASAHEVTAWFREAQEKAPYVAWDTEYLFDSAHPRDDSNYTLTMLGAGYPGMSAGIQLLYFGGDAAGWEKAEFITQFWRLTQAKRNLFHNGIAEMRSTQRTWGWNPATFWGRFDDTMLWHAVYWSELEHTLSFLESMHGRHHKMKHLPTTDPLRNWGDVLTTMYAWEDMQETLRHDPASAWVYRTQSLALVPLIYARMVAGIAVNQTRVIPAMALYQEKQRVATQLAHAYCGWPINLNSPAQLGHWLYEVEGLPLQRAKKSKQRTVSKDAIATLRAQISAFDTDWEANNSASVPYILQRIEEGGHPLLEALTLHGEAGHVLEHYLNPLIQPTRAAQAS